MSLFDRLRGRPEEPAEPGLTPLELRPWLEEHGAVYGVHFTFGGLGEGVAGVEVMGGFPYTYIAEKPSSFRKTNYERHTSMEEACKALKDTAIKKATADGVWTG